MSDPNHPEPSDEFSIVQKLRELKQRFQQATGSVEWMPEHFDSSRYVPGKQLHESEQRVVFLARDQVLDREVVIKLFAVDDAANQKQIADEGKRLASLQSPFVCTCFDLGWSAGQPFLVLEAIAGRPMSEQNPGPPAGDWLSLTDVMIDVCRGVEDMHAVDLVHWDLKPANIMIGPDKRPKIVDLGLSLFCSDVDLETRLLQGSPAYLAPEVARGDGFGDGFTIDIFGIGAVLYEALTGQPPFQRETRIATLEASFRGQVVAPCELTCGVPRRLESICLRCMAENPDDRFSSAQAVRAELEAFRDSLKHKRKKAVALTIGGLLVAAGMFLVLSRLTQPATKIANNAGSGLLKQGIPAQYDSTKVSLNQLGEALESRTTSRLVLRNDFSLQVTFLQQGKPVVPMSLLPDVDIEVKLEADRPCYVSVHRFEFKADNQFFRALSEYPPSPAWCQSLDPRRPLSFVTSETAATNGPSCYYVIAAELEWNSRGEFPNGRLAMEPNHRGVATKQPVAERIIPFAIFPKSQ